MELNIDLAFLERFCKQDRRRMVRYVRLYLEGSPALFDDLQQATRNKDATAIATLAHALRPQAHYMGAAELVALLEEMEQRARAGKCDQAAVHLGRCLALNDRIVPELKDWVLKNAEVQV